MGNLKKKARLEFISDMYEACKLRDLGFKYFKSSDNITREDNGFVESISFGSTRSNILPDTNIIIIHAAISDIKFGIWEKELGYNYADGFIAGAQIKNLFNPGPPYIYFDLKEEIGHRNRVLLDVVECINTDVMKFFDICKDIEKIKKNIFLPCFDISNILTYMVFKFGMKVFDDFIDYTSSVYPNLRTDIDCYKTRILTTGEPIAGFEDSFGDVSKHYAIEIAKFLIKIDKHKQMV